MKKYFATLALVVSFLVSSPSQAFVGFASDSDATAIAGLALIDLSQIWVADSRTTTRRYDRRRGWSRTTYVTYRVITYPAFLVAGLVLLDDRGRAQIGSELSEEQIETAELTTREVEAFQREIEEINALKDLISSEISYIENDQDRMEEAGRLWSEYAEVLSKDSAVALFKLANLDK